MTEIIGENEIKKEKLFEESETDLHVNWKSINWSCYFCGQILKEYKILKNHIESSHKNHNLGRDYFKCKDCNIILLGYASFLNHIRKIHHENLKLTCDVCNETFYDYNQLSLHRGQHIETINSTYPTVYHCTLCENVHSTEKQLKVHIQISHLVLLPHDSSQTIKEEKFEISQTSTDSCDVQNPMEPVQCKDEYNDTELVFSCSKCVQSFKNETDLMVHMKTHEGNFSNKCDFCSKTFKWWWQLHSHMRSHTNDRAYKCEICDTRFAYESNLAVHMRIHNGNNVFNCTVCSEEFTTKKEFQFHIRIHTVESPHRCEVCEKRFQSEKNLRVHMRMHTGSYQCGICSKTFIYKSYLKRHLRRHTGERSHKCHTCEKSFYDNSSLMAHIRIHTGEQPFQCEICPKAFTRIYNLRRHMTEHDENE